MNGTAPWLRRIVYALLLPIVLLVLWWFASVRAHSFFFPSPPAIVESFVKVWFTSRFWLDVVPSVLRLIGGYVLAGLIGIALGIAIGTSQRLRAFLEPVLEFLRAVPPPVLVPVFILFAGIGDTMRVLVVISGCLWPVLLNTIQGVRSLDEVLADVARCYRLSRWRVLFEFVLPGASPQIATGLRQSLSIGIILMVIGEMFAARNGLGFTLIQFQRTFAVPEMWSGVLLLGIIGILLAAAFRFTENRALAWYHGQRRAEREAA